jgi:acyl-CoA oxidase
MTDTPQPPKAPSAWPVDRLDLLAFLPMIQVAWSDGVLTSSEMAALCEELEEQGWLDPRGREFLRSWLRPESPPPRASVAELREIVRNRWPEDRNVPESLTSLGLDLIRGAGLTAGPWSQDGAPAALARAEERLGVPGPEAVYKLLGIPNPGRGAPGPDRP